MRLLLDRGINLDAKDARGRTALDLATSSRREREDIVALLRERAAQ